MKTFLRAFALLFCVASFAQTTVKGTVSDDSGMPLAGANIIITGTSTGVVADFDGNFTLSVSENPPFTIQVSSVGFETLSQDVTKNNETLSITLKEGNPLDEVVISASRTPERIFESPVTVERFGIRDIKATASADFYGGLENMKGVDVNVNSLTFQSINTRGFATTANNRFMQLVDGMDNSTPALNFPIGNLVGMIEPDVQSVELLPGASSALYGAGAFNGILVMTSKNPFDSDGISVSLKRGITSQEAAGDNAYTDFSIRMAHKFSNKFAAKANFGWLKGHDWVANNLTSKTTGATRAATNYDGINVYGDERAANLQGIALSMENTINPATGLPYLPAGTNALFPSVDVTRTGYNEQDLTNYNAESIKADWGLYFRPFENDFEISYVGKVGSGTTLFQGINRYNIKNFLQQQHKIEVKNDNFFARLYKVSDDAGDSYDMYATGLLINEAWKPSTQWFPEYAGAYLQAFSGLIPGVPAGDNDAAHATGRIVADTGRLAPGSPGFQQAFNAVTADATFGQGSKFVDKSSYTHFDANYNFGHLIDIAEIQVGVSKRWWNLNSEGNIYTDIDGPITYEDFGLYTQIQKGFLEDDRLKVTASVRYDDSSVFEGFVSPRLSLGYTAGQNKNHNIRMSYQTGFRSPTTQDLYIGLDAGSAILIGGAPDNGGRYPGGGAGEAYTNSFSLASVQLFGANAAAGNVDVSLLEIANPDYIKPEQIRTFEAGYRGKLNNLNIDLSVYSNSITDFISTRVVVSPGAGLVDLSDGGIAAGAIGTGNYQAYSTYTNSEAAVKSFGGSVALSTKVFGGFNLNTNYTYAKLDFDKEAYPDFNTNFNTPEHKVKVGFGKVDLFENFGFNMAWRWSDNYEWEASFGNGEIPAYHTMDAQINYTVPSIKSTFKAGATNLLGDEYFTMFGSGYIGSMYYLSWTINN